MDARKRAIEIFEHPCLQVVDPSVDREAVALVPCSLDDACMGDVSHLLQDI